jgi:DivIVA domain-containing protein
MDSSRQEALAERRSAQAAFRQSLLGWGCVHNSSRARIVPARASIGVSGQRRVPGELRSVAFPVAVRGYDRGAVDAYVTRVNRLIAELEATRSPQSAVQNALRRTEDERSDILKEAYALAGEVAAAARREADEMTTRAKAEAVEIVVNASEQADRTRVESLEQSARARAESDRLLDAARAEAEARLQRAEDEITRMRKEAEAWMRALRIDTNTVWGERRDLLEDLRTIATRLQEAASHSAADAGSPDDPSR